MTDEMLKAGAEAVWDFHPDRTIEENEQVAVAAFTAMFAALENAGLVLVPLLAVDWLKKNYPVLCEKSGMIAAP